ncbi:hypothetical protein SISNIDRAFT_463669 [Sistotremastrum niveocremeum HHB9708]|uniref:Uncharacterized protein n=2 Tax=Sistotremastraceae TaxID=3402574 RepID=A0A164YIG6_9AGAM|nr:hypothetical protein SISNIDRAFT_463669 [Sistotremastrum niveocremeum HHB9708]KZT43366.1 hypothetical protein SISSUDRAFT_690628 [Sistotremastrum suecicum HHB10207 ss-3]
MATAAIAAAVAASIFTSTVTQWYYTKSYGANGLPKLCGFSCRFDCGWADEQVNEVRTDLAERAHELEAEIREINIQKKLRERGEGAARAANEAAGRARVAVLSPLYLFGRGRRRGADEDVEMRQQTVDEVHDADSTWTAVDHQPGSSLDLNRELEERHLRAELEDINEQRLAIASHS